MATHDVQDGGSQSILSCLASDDDYCYDTIFEAFPWPFLSTILVISGNLPLSPVYHFIFFTFGWRLPLYLTENPILLKNTILSHRWVLKVRIDVL